MLTEATATAAPLDTRTADPAAELVDHLLCPNGRALLTDDGRAASPAALAGSLGVAGVGSALFLIATLAGTSTGALSGAIAPILGAVLLGGLLTFPPLVLVSALTGGRGSVLNLAAAASVGPAVAGAWLGAATPVLIVHRLGTTPDIGFWLLAFGLGALAFRSGGIAAAKRAWAVGAAGPGVVASLVHYVLTAWTVVVLAIHLS